MSTLCFLFTSYNKQIYGKPIKVAKKNEGKFAQVEAILLKAQIPLEDYTLTTFADRVEVGVKLGFLPANVFISENSLKKYVQRLEQGCEVTKKKDEGPDWLNIELAYGDAYILNIKQGYGWTTEEIENYATTYGWTSNPNRTPELVEYCRKFQCQKHRCPADWTLDQIGAMEIERRKFQESKRPPKPLNPPPGEVKPAKKKDWRFWRHPDEAPEDED